MTDQSPQPRSRIQSRAVLWGLIAIYTLLIPNAIYIYRFIEARFGLLFAGKIPLVIVILLGAGYVVYLWRSKLGWTKLLYMIPSAVIVLAIFRLEANPNKHIHIPEYILMAWLVYFALKKDYRGGGMLILVFICASMLGVVDELEQGIHPARSYGWKDMLVNTSSALIGVFTILGLTGHQESGWDWMEGLKRVKPLLGLVLAGIIINTLMCIYLFRVQANGGILKGYYPDWLLILNYLFLVLAPLLFLKFNRITRLPLNLNQKQSKPLVHDKTGNVRCWIYPILAILLFMDLLLIFVSITGLTFK